MAAVLLSPTERARKNQSTVLQRLNVPGLAVSLASNLGVSESTISRMKNEHLEVLCALLAHAGLKIVSGTHACVDRESYEAMTLIATKAMADKDIARKLIWEEE